MEEDIYYSTDSNRYSKLEQESPNAYTRKTISGAFVGCSKCVGYCLYQGHPGFLTQKQRRQHDCINKECNHYIAKQKTPKEHHRSYKDNDPDMLPLIQKSVTDEGVKVIRVENSGFNEYKAYYVTITNEYSFSECEQNLSSNYGMTVTFIRQDGDFEIIAKLLYGN